MIGEPSSIRRTLDLFRDPVTAEKRDLMKQRWDALDPQVRASGQGLGRKATGCGATAGIQPKCDFSCTGCYLGSEANTIPPLSLAEVLAQLDQLRAHLGPKSNVQITDGEVTLRPIEELITILSYARSIGIVPMVMTHGDNFRRHPGMLERLMVEGSLTEVSIHIDITQRGRDGHRAPKSELELMGLRDEFAEMIRSARRTTGRRLRAATTMTITRDNLPQVADVVRWNIRNRDAFSLISFQPLAQVGRTRKGLEGVTPQELWHEVNLATSEYGANFTSTEPMHFGHADCTRFIPMLATQSAGCDRPKLMQFIRDEPDDVAIMEEFLNSGLGGAAFRDDRPWEMVARGAGMLRRRPLWFLGRARRWINSRLREEAGTTFLPLFAKALAGRIRVDGLTLTSHHFMSPDELYTDVGKARLDACVFKIPHHGEMVPMCQMNAGGSRDELYAELLTRKGPVQEAQV